MNRKLGFIGVGNMANAIIHGVVGNQIAAAEDISVFDVNDSKMEAMQKKIGVSPLASMLDLAERSDMIFLSVKPHIVPHVLKKISARITDSKIIVSIAAGVPLQRLEEHVGHPAKIIRVMPNTPALVNAGMSSLTANEQVNRQELAEVEAIFNSFGRSAIVPESHIHAVTGVSGSGPAYVFLFIEALADAGVLGGLPREQAYTFAAQTVLGAAKMVLETDEHPGLLKDKVCSPGGTTIEAVRILEEKGLRSAVIEAAVSCMKKSHLLSKGEK